VGHSKGSLRRKVYSHEHPHQKSKEISNKQSDDGPKTQKNKYKPIPKIVEGNEF
jgi:hypothetical protein